MRTVRPSVPEDIPAQRKLWKLAFGDSDEYIDNFYSTYYCPERVLVLEEEGVVRSMTAWFDTTFVVPGRGSTGRPTSTPWPPTPTAGAGGWRPSCWPGRMNISAL